MTSRWGGFPISHTNALAWANRILAADNEPLLTNAPNHSGAIMHTLEDVVRAATEVCAFISVVQNTSIDQKDTIGAQQ